MARPQSGSKLPRDYTSVIEVTRDQNADQNNLLWKVNGSHRTVRPEALCTLSMHSTSIAQTKVATFKKTKEAISIYAQHRIILLLYFLSI
jgi:hypothetical protein